jgi:Tol biopolymer transport system component
MRYLTAVWMPDGLRFLFTARAKGRPFRVYVQDLSGGATRPFGPEGYGLGCFVSPDGKVAVLNKEGTWYFFPVEGGEPRPIPGIGPDVIDVLRWNRTGRALFLRKEKGQSVEIWSLDVDSGRSERIGSIGPSDTTGALGVDTLFLTPDGKTYAYSVQRRLSTLFVVTGLK